MTKSETKYIKSCLFPCKSGKQINLLKHSSVLFIERHFSFVSFFQEEHLAPARQPDLHPPRLLWTMQFPEILMQTWHLNINPCAWYIIAGPLTMVTLFIPSWWNNLMYRESKSSRFKNSCNAHYPPLKAPWCNQVNHHSLQMLLSSLLGLLFYIFNQQVLNYSYRHS